MPMTEEKRRAKKKWDENNKEKKQIIVLRASAKRFIREFANEEDILNFKEYINEREKTLLKQ